MKDSPPLPRAIALHAADNVCTLLDDAPAGRIRVDGAADEAELVLTEPVARGHKAALRPIPGGGEVIKYGVPIGVAAGAIPAGAWVHLHNCRSRLDERSSTLDVHTGAPTDTAYDADR